MKRGLGWRYPNRVRCLRCRQFFAWTIVDGLYDSWECAGRPAPPFEDWSDWPRQHYVWTVRGGKRAKVPWADEADALVAAARMGISAYVCGYCGKWHIGGGAS